MPTNATPKTAAPMKSVAHDDDEALAAAIVDEALQGLENLLSPDAMERVRQELVDALLIDPTGSRLLRRAKADASVNESAKVTRRGREPYRVTAPSPNRKRSR